MASKQEMVEAVKAHAAANYETGGWDIIVECYGDAEIIEAIGKARTTTGAIKKVAWAAGIMGSHRAEIAATAF